MAPRAQRERKNGVGRRVGRCGNPSGSRGGSLREPGWVARWVAAGTRVGRGVGRCRTRVGCGVGHCGNLGGSRGGSPPEPGWVAAGVPAGTERAAAAVQNLPRFGLGSAGLRHHLSCLWQSPSRLGHRRRFHPPNFHYYCYSYCYAYRYSHYYSSMHCTQAPQALPPPKLPITL